MVRDLLERLVSVVAIGVTGVMCPLVAAFSAAVRVLFGANWAGVGEILPGAAFALVFSGPVAIVVFGLLYARGDAKTLLRVSILHVVVRIPLTLSLLPVVGPAAIGIGWVAGVFAEMPFPLASVRRLTGARLMRRILPASAGGTVATGAGWMVAEHLGQTPLSALAAAALGGVGYLGFMLVFARPDVARQLRCFETPGAPAGGLNPCSRPERPADQIKARDSIAFMRGK